MMARIKLSEACSGDQIYHLDVNLKSVSDGIEQREERCFLRLKSETEDLGMRAER